MKLTEKFARCVAAAAVFVLLAATAKPAKAGGVGADTNTNKIGRAHV